MSHVILLGDSIFDNSSYVPGEESVINQVSRKITDDWKATLLARDGDTIANVIEQLKEIPTDASHLFLSVGGNDALGHSHILRAGSDSFLAEFSDIYFDFSCLYEEMIKEVLKKGIPTTVCTIYNEIPELDREAVMALSLFNDSIIRIAAKNALPIIDLRLVCCESDDYSALSPIEPSNKGGAKIAAAIASVVRDHSFESRRTTIYA